MKTRNPSLQWQVSCSSDPALLAKVTPKEFVQIHLLSGPLLFGGSQYLVFEVSGCKNHTSNGFWDQRP